MNLRPRKKARIGSIIDYYFGESVRDFRFGNCLLLVGCAALSGKSVSLFFLPALNGLSWFDFLALRPVNWIRPKGKGSKEVLPLLLAHGADVNAKDRSGITPLDLAIGSGDIEIVELFRKHGAKE